MFTRGPDELRNTAIFVGGSNVTTAEENFQAVTESFFGPLRVSVMLDANGCNTTAAAAVLAASRELELAGATSLVLGGTGPVGQRVVRLLARAGARVRVASRREERATAVCASIAETLGRQAEIRGHQVTNSAELDQALEGVAICISAGAAGATLLPQENLQRAESLRVAVDLNAVPPAGIEGVEVTAKAALLGNVTVYGAIGVGGTKMKIHHAAIRRLFQSNDAVLDAEEIMDLGRQLN